MKHSIILFLTIILISGFSAIYAQTDATIDFLDINNSSLKQVFKYDQKVRVRINNINRFIYKISEEKTEEDFNVTVPAQLSSLELPAYLTTKMLGANETVADSRVTKESISGKSATDLQYELDQKFKKLVDINININKAIDAHNVIVHLSKNCEQNFSQIEEAVKKAIILLPVGGATADPISSLADRVRDFLKGNIELSNKIIGDMEELIKAWQKKVLTENRGNQKPNDDKLASAKSELETLEAQKPRNEGNINGKKREIRDFEREIKQKNEDDESAKKDNQEMLEKAKELVSEINKYDEDGNIFILVDDIRKVNQANYTYYSATVLMKKDEYKYNISAVSEELLTCNKFNEQKMEVILRTKGGLKLDFSTGAFIMGGSEDFLGRSYYYKPINETESSIAAADKGNRALLGIGALMHIYKRSPSLLKLGAAIGVSSTFSFDAVNFHLGPSLILGDKDRFCITLGLTARQVDLLDEKYTLDHVYTNEELPDNFLTFKMFPKFGGFFSLTYNISRFKK